MKVLNKRPTYLKIELIIMLRSIKYELKPNKSQQAFIKKTCGCVRFVYNISLFKKNQEYKINGLSPSSYELIKDLTELKKQEDYNFLNSVPSQALQQSILNLEQAYKYFFKNKQHFRLPKFKKKGVKDSFRIPLPCRVDYSEWKVKVAKLGWVKIYKGHNKQINGTIKSYTISRTSTDRYYISILYETADRVSLNNGKSVGIDLGIKSFAVLSSGEVFENQKYLRKNLAKLKVLQRSASRKYQKGKKREDQSNNWKKAMMKVSKLHERIRFQRKDYLEKVSTWISRNYSTVCVESLSIKKMMKKKNHNLSREIGDCGWGMFIEMLSRKCDQVLMIDTYFPSSQTCSVCGYIEKSVKNLNVRTWTCPVCGSIHDRDLNAAQNILREGLSLCGHKVNLSSTCPKISSANSKNVIMEYSQEPSKPYQ